MLERLSLIVTQACNLDCSYCYAKVGNANSNALFMSPTLATEIVNHFYRNFNIINNIFFFGGEPLLSIKVIEEVCKYCERLFLDNKIPRMPYFSLVTNGTLISDKIVKFLKKFNFGLSVSLDGPPNVHDIHRRTKENKKTYAQVLEGIKKLKHANQSFCLECTYTLSHLEKGISFIDIYEYFKKLGADEITIVPQMPLGKGRMTRNKVLVEKILPSYIDFMIHCLKDSLDTGKIINEELGKGLKSIVKKSFLLENNFCNAGISYFAVNPEGLTFPCHMLNNQKAFCLGIFRNVKKKVNVFPKKQELDKCSECPVKFYCRSCPGRMYLVSGSVYPIDVQCKISTAMVSCAIWYLTSEYRVS